MSGNKPQKDLGSPSGAALSLPLRRYARQASLAPSSGLSHIDKETLSQTLDHIHSEASQSESLITFNEYTAPPSVSEGGEGRSITNELQGGLSGLYNRLKASVGGVRDTVAGGGGPDEDESADNVSIQSPKSATPSATPSTKQLLGLNRQSIPGASSGTDTGPSTALQSPRIAVVEISSNDPVPSSKISRIPTATLSRTSSSAAAALKPPTTPLTPTLPTVSASPAVVEVNVTAFTEAEPRSRHEDTLNRTSTINKLPPKTATTPRVEERVSSALDSVKVDEQMKEHTIHSHSRPDSMSKHLPEALRVADEEISLAEITAAIGSTSTGGQSSGSLEDPSVVGNVSSVVQESGHIDASNLPIARTSSEARNTAEGASSLDNSHRTTNIGERKQASMGNLTPGPIAEKSGNNHSVDGMSAVKAGTAPQLGQSPLPGFNLSRGSSSETAGTNSVNTTMYQKSSNGGPSDDEAIRKRVISQFRDPVKQEAERPNVNLMLSQNRSRVLSKEYWMRDENARDCFYCGDSFSTFRRKHHCRKSLCK